MMYAFLCVPFLDNVNIQVDDNMTSGGEASIEPSVHVQLGENDRWERGVNMGHGLHRMNRAMRGKLPVVILEGRIRPVAPLVAAKYTTECNIAVRNHVPVYKHWKDYKNHNGMFNLFTDKLSVSALSSSSLPIKYDIPTLYLLALIACLHILFTPALM